MKPQILVVDDNPLLLRSLERALRPDARRWNIHFALGVAAVFRLREQVFEVVVSDFDMASISGKDVLALAALTSPAALRLMLTAREGLVPWQVSAHAILIKPCSVEVLRGLIELRISNGMHL